MTKIRMTVGALVAAAAVALTLGAGVPTEAAQLHQQNRPFGCC